VEIGRSFSSVASPKEASAEERVYVLISPRKLEFHVQCFSVGGLTSFIMLELENQTTLWTIFPLI